MLISSKLAMLITSDYLNFEGILNEWSIIWRRKFDLDKNLFIILVLHKKKINSVENKWKILGILFSINVDLSLIFPKRSIWDDVIFW